VTTPAPIAVALDAPDLETAARWAGLVTPHVSTVKVGLELYLRYGPDVIASVRGASGVQVFWISSSMTSPTPWGRRRGRSPGSGPRSSPSTPPAARR